MHAKKIQIENYGPIDCLEIVFPFNGDNPKPILLVGQNGSGKSVLLSHIVNGLMSAQGILYPENSEVEKRKVFKLRSPTYIKSGSEYFWAKIEFDLGLSLQEFFLKHQKEKFKEKPEFSFESINQIWDSMPQDRREEFSHNFSRFDPKHDTSNPFEENCILYFPPNRFQEPAWLNEENLKSKAEYTILRHIQGYAYRKIIQHSPLRDNQNWFFDIICDQRTFEIVITDRGMATSIYEIIIEVIRRIFSANRNLRFEIGRRQNRQVSLMQKDQILVPNIFQLSTGETSLLNLFLSILRDFDSTGQRFTKTEEIRGIVVVDEIDLHLHTIHQYDVLPALMKMFPRVQFIVTTHSPFFILGMQKTFREDGFSLYELPQGQEISPEEFSEFGNAYRSFTETKKFKEDIRKEIENAQKPVVFMEGKTDVKYLKRAAELLGKKELLQRVELEDEEGYGNLDNIWRSIDPQLSKKIIPQKIILLYDCDKAISKDTKTEKGKVFKRHIPLHKDHPLKEGIENLFDEETLERVRESEPAFIDIEKEHKKIVGGEEGNIPEKWDVNPDQKTKFCDWLCKYGTKADFKYFRVVFDLLKEILES